MTQAVAVCFVLMAAAIIVLWMRVNDADKRMRIHRDADETYKLTQRLADVHETHTRRLNEFAEALGWHRDLGSPPQWRKKSKP